MAFNLSSAVNNCAVDDDGVVNDWPGVNCGLSVSRKPVSINDSRFDEPPNSAGLITLFLSVRSDIDIMLCDVGGRSDAGDASWLRDPIKL